MIIKKLRNWFNKQYQCECITWRILSNRDIRLKWCSDEIMDIVANKLIEIVNIRDVKWFHIWQSFTFLYKEWDDYIEIWRYKSNRVLVKKIYFNNNIYITNRDMSNILKEENRSLWYVFVENQYDTKIKVTLSSDWKIRLKNKSKTVCDRIYEKIKHIDIPKHTLRWEYILWNKWFTIKNYNKTIKVKIDIL